MRRSKYDQSSLPMQDGKDVDKDCLLYTSDAADD